MVTNTESRQKFVKSVVTFLDKYNFDGLDLDWEYPGNRGGAASDIDNYVKLLEELKEAFKPHGFLLTAAVSPGRGTIDRAYIIPKLNELLDWANIMAYDYHGGFDDYLGHNAPLYSRPDETEELERKLHQNYRTFNVDYTINYYATHGLSKDKMIMGVPFYGRAWTLMNASQNHLHDEARGMSPAGYISHEEGVFGYNEMCQMIIENPSQWGHSYDKDYRAPYSWTKDIFVGYDNVDSIQCKVYTIY
ncbi:unnamed protein product, partial [Oppiella nova]